MTPETFGAVYEEKRKRLAAISREDKLKYILERGWFESERCKFGIFYHHPDRSGGVLLDMAYEFEYQKTLEDERKDALEKGIASVKCNKCGCDCQKFSKNINDEKFSVGYYGLIDANVQGGYESVELSDCVEYTFSLCEKCLKELFVSFKTPPKYYIYMP